MKQQAENKPAGAAAADPTKRDFLRGAALVAAGAVAVPLLGACGESTNGAAGPCRPDTADAAGAGDLPGRGDTAGAGDSTGAGDTAGAGDVPVDPGFDREVDVVVVGAGTGLVAALAAAVAGASTLVLEKSPETGGSTKLSGGVAWIPVNHVMAAEGIADSRQGAIDYLRILARGQADDALIEAFVDKGPEMALFVEAHTTMTWRKSVLLGDYHPEWPGGVAKGRSIEPDVGGFLDLGPDLIEKLQEGVVAAGGEVLTGTPATRLLTRLLPDGRQEVLGVEALGGEGPLRIKARKGVILTAGGFDWDFEMKRHFLRGPSLYTLGHSGNTGDGIRMAAAAGADLRNMNEVWGATVFKAEAEALLAQNRGANLTAMIQRRMPGSITVNRYGQRFSNEASDYDSAWRTYFAWENFGTVECRNLPAFQISDKKVKPPASAAAVEAQTLRELAEALGIDPDALEATVATFNANVQAGADPEFHRGESSYDTSYGPTLGGLTSAPFYGAEVAPADLGTCGGVRVNASAQALTPFGDVVPRLYAAGNNAGVGGPGAGYGGGGGTIGPAMAFAFIAGQHVATLEPHDG